MQMPTRAALAALILAMPMTLAGPGILAGPGSALAAAPADLDPGGEPAVPTYQLGTVLVVHDWVLCTTQASAESLARAREAGVSAAEKAYADLAAAKTCGRFKKLGVMLREPLYHTAPGLDVDARVFDALVNVGAGWQNGFVVAGGLPE
jgi:hypothetical protein